MGIRMKTKILLFDIETAPNLGYVWGKWEQDVIEFKDNWYILCFCAKWLDSSRILKSSLPMHTLYRKDKENDKEVVKELWKLLNEADIVIAHNGDQFDIKKANARFIFHGLKPPAPYKTIDTRKVARRYFKFDSNKLDELGRYLNIGRKMKHEGFSLWLRCMAGDRKAWNKMLKYNKQDVLLLEQIYKKFLPWVDNHPNRLMFEGIDFGCPNCSSLNLKKKGYAYTSTNTYQRYRCGECGKNCKDRLPIKITRPLIK